MTAGQQLTVFEIEASASSQTILKLLNYFALRDILPHKVAWCVSAGICQMKIETEHLTFEVAAVIAEKMRSQVNVSMVTLNRKRLNQDA